MTLATSVGRSTPAPADRRLGERWTRRQAIKNLLIACAVRAAFVLADRIPAAWLLALGRRAGRLMGRVAGRARRAALENAACALSPEDARRVARACFERAGENLAASLLLRRPSVRALDWVKVPEPARELLSRTLAPGRGAVVVSAHLGPFELITAVVAELGYAPSIVVRESYDPRLDRWVDAHRLARGAEVIHRGAPSAGRRMLRALHAGRPVGLLPDLGARVRSLEVPFMGASRPFPVGPQEIARRARCPLIVGTLARRTPTAMGEPPFELELTELDANGTLDEVTRRVAESLESAIRGSPDDWLWMAARRDEPRWSGAPGPLDLSASCCPRTGSP